MPRTSRTRSLEGEANLARRIQLERESRGLSYEALAQAMTDVGCKMQGSAIFKIEKGDPPRRVTVDELLALVKVFDLEVTNLLTPMELLEQQRAQELVAQMEQLDRDLWSLTERMFQTRLEQQKLDPETREYVAGHYGRSYAEDRLILAGVPEDARDAVYQVMWPFIQGIGEAAYATWHRETYSWSDR